jgi:hypothetical protein
LTYRTFALTGATLCGLVVIWSVSPKFRELTGTTPEALRQQLPTARELPSSRAPRPIASPIRRALPAAMPTPAPAAASPVASHTAPARPALGFHLDESTRSEVRFWTQQHGLDCRDSKQRQLDFWVCDAVNADALGLGAEPEIRFVAFGFAPDDTLISVSLVRPGMQTPDMLELVRAERLRLAPKLGSPTAVHGELSAEFLDRGGQLKVEYRYGDYLAILRAAGKPGSAGEVGEFFESNRALSLYYP